LLDDTTQVLASQKRAVVDIFFLVNINPRNMADEQPAAPANEQPAAAAAPAGEEGPSKKALKKAAAKAAKEAEKAKRAAEREAAEKAAKAKAGPTEDLATEFYGLTKERKTKPQLSPEATEINLKNVGKEHVGKLVVLRAWLQNSRIQGAKMAFAELREEGSWTIQAVVAANAEGTISKQMVRWIAGVNPESFVLVEGTIQEPLEPVKSCRVSNFELHVRKLYVTAAAPTMLGMTLTSANRPITNFSDEQPVEADLEKLSIAESAAAAPTIPAATMLTHLDNIVMHKRAPIQQAIADIRMEIKHLFREYLRNKGFKEFEPPCLIGAASEGGANVFQLPYFGTTACLAQSPQFYKQMEIAGGRKRVFSIGPVFR
jgi:aspartyl-tRNA synthetase